jgi:16S rRNA processing protein RimM
VSAPVEIAVILRPHGVKGALKVRLHNPETQLLEAGCELLLQGRPVRLRAVRDLPDGGRVVELEGVATRDQAEALRGQALSVPQEALPELAEGEFYHVELIGGRAVREDGSLIGTILAISRTTVDVLEVRRPDGSTLDIPVTPDFVKRVDRRAGVVVAVEPEWE